MSRKFIDITGKKFGKLIVLKLTGKMSGHHKLWLCKCDCGNITTSSADNLKRKMKKSCGCNKKLPFGEAMFNHIYNQYKNHAKERKLEFNLTKDYFKYLINQPCIYCGTECSNFTNRKDYNGNIKYNGIDRINNNLGYIDGNVITCCNKCNKWKLTYSINDFLLHVEKIYNYQIQKKLLKAA